MKTITMQRQLMLVVSLMCTSVVAEEPQWNLQKKQDGIEVYTAEVEGSDFKAFYATTDVQATLTQLVALHLDVDAVPSWLQDCKKSELVKKVKDNEYFVYYVTAAPWPVQDRDYVLHSVITQNADSHIVEIRFEAATEMRQPTDGCVRSTDISGYWRFSPKTDGWVHIEYEAHADPNGSIPAWLANAFVVDQPYKTLAKLRLKIGDEKYRKASVPFIKNP